MASQPPRSDGIVLHIAWVRWWSALAYYALSLAEGMRACGAPSCVLSPPGSPLAQRAPEPGPVARGLAGLASFNPTRAWPAVRRLRALVRAGEVSAVIVHTGAGHAASALALRGTAAPLLRARPEIRPPASHALARWLYGRATDRILVPGEFARPSTARALGLPGVRIAVLPAGLARSAAPRRPVSECRRRLRAGAGWPEDAVVVGMLARYSPVKGQTDLIEAARVLRPRHERVRFFLAGPEGQTGREAIEQAVRTAGLAGRCFVGEAVAEPLEAAAGFDVAVIASRGSEAVCRSALEYMSLGVPIVATNVNVIPETVGDAGRIVPPERPDLLAGGIEAFLLDPGAAAEAGARGLARIRDHFDRDQLAGAALAILAEAARERRG